MAPQTLFLNIFLSVDSWFTESRVPPHIRTNVCSKKPGCAISTTPNIRICVSNKTYIYPTVGKLFSKRCDRTEHRKLFHQCSWDFSFGFNFFARPVCQSWRQPAAATLKVLKEEIQPWTTQGRKWLLHSSLWVEYFMLLQAYLEFCHNPRQNSR